MTSPSPKTGKFVTGSIRRHIVTMAFSSGAGLLAIFFVDLADLYFISLLGEAQLAAAVGFAGTILFFFTSIGIGLAIAMGSLTARALGKGDEARAREVAGSVAAINIALGIASAASILIFAPQMLDIIGAEGETKEYATGYLRICALGTPFLMLGMSGGAVLRSHGDARRAMTTTLSAAAANGILDPILIFGFGLDLTGAAIATVISRIVLASVAWGPVIKVYDGIARPSLPSLRADLAPVFAIAGPGILTNVATPVGNAFVTRIISEFGTQAIAGYAVVGRLTPFAFCLIFGLSGAVGPIIGQNFGAGQYDRVRKAMVTALGFVALYVVGVALVFWMFRDSIAGIFGAEGEARELIFLFCGPLALAFFFNGALFCTNAAFNNLDRPLYSTALNWGKHTIGTVPFAWAGAQMYGASGALIGQYVGGAIFAGLAVWMAFRLIDGHANGTVQPRPTALEAITRFAQWPFSNLR